GQHVGIHALPAPRSSAPHIRSPRRANAGVTEIDVRDVGQLSELRARVAQSAAQADEATRAALRVAQELLGQLGRETQRRADAYAGCEGDDECRELYRRWQVAASAEREFAAVLAETARSLDQQHRYIDELTTESNRYLAGLQAHLAATPA